MSKKQDAKTVATTAGIIAAVAVGGFAAYVLGLGTYKWVKHDILKFQEK